MKVWKKLLSVGLAAFIVLGAIGCKTNNDPGDSSKGSNDAEEEITLRFRWWGGDERAEATIKVIELFEKENKNITIEYEPSSDSGYNEKLATEYQGKTAPDIIQMGVGWMPDYVKQGGLFIDFKDYDIDLSGFEKSFLDANGTFDGHVYGLPTGVSGSALLVNNKLMNDVGIDLTEQYTFQDLIEMGKKVQEHDPELYLLAAEPTIMRAWIVRTWARQKNDRFLIDNDAKELTLSQEDMIELLQFIKDLYDNNVIPPASYISVYGTDLQTDPNWIAGKYVAAMCYTSTINVLADANENAEWITGKLPVMEASKNDGWYTDCPQYMTVYSGSEHPEAAVKFLDFFYNSEEAMRILGTVRSVPPTVRAREICTEEKLMTAVVESSTNICLTYNGKSDAGLSTSAEMEAILNNMIEKIGFNSGSVEQIATESITEINRFLENQN